MRARRAVLAAALVLAGACAAAAQDFPAIEPPGPAESSSSLIERALPSGSSPGMIESGMTSWLGVPGLVTRAACSGVAVGPWRAALGWSSTGPTETGWDALGVAFGAVAEPGGAALRAVGRRERVSEPGAGATDADGIELGAGAWARAGRRAAIWARAPQIWTGGMSPPLSRPLAVGVAIDLGGVSAWLERAGPPRARDESGANAFGLALGTSGAGVWVEGRDRPLRGVFGLVARTRGVAVGARAEEHPVLGDTVSLWVALTWPRGKAGG